MPLFKWQKKAEGEADGDINIKLSDEDQKKIDTAAAAATELPEIKKRLEGLDSVVAFVNDQKKKDADAAAAAARKKTEEHAAASQEELEELMLTDPKKAIDLATSAQQRVILEVRADNLRRNTFEDEKRFPYYTGEMKSEIDKLISGQSLQFQNDASVLENAYNAVVGKHMPDILEGKIKNRFAASSNGTTLNGSAGAGAGSGDGERRWKGNEPDVIKAARIAGMSNEDYAKLLDKEGVGYV